MAYPQPSYPPPPAQPTKSPWYKRVWVIAVASAVVGIGIGAASAASSKTKTVAGPTVTATATQTAHPTATNTVRVTGHPTKVIATHTRTHTVTYTPPPKPAFSDGTYHVGIDIKPGEYRTSGGQDCYWERDKDLSGDIESTINNDNITGSAIVDLERGQYFKVSGGCEWRRS